ncbi:MULTISPECIES: transposase [unclassified Variovorax]|uniref:transposase n=1 Tax=unclassified Variovorax TaxID=663243 RepID=UPI000F7D7790|nr:MULTISPECIES: transposase [unclassified Variovorax]RSZ29330.1 transposase [Variovorax sp. 553]RSZ29656.1 transposase [Variovorax sp. 679]
MDTIKDSKRLTRRRHDAALKAQVLAECAKPEASVAGIALAHGLNANLVHKWRRMAAGPSTQKPVVNPIPAHSFIALPVAPPVVTPAQELVIELRRGTLMVKATWPITAAAECAAWMRELLR